MDVVRIGVLGAARIVPMALTDPAREVPEVAITALAARDPQRARAFAAKVGVARVHDSYEALLADPEIDAVYNPLPNGLHGRWTIAALEAGKHVLCEKPFAANADEAAAMAEAARRSGLVCMEAFHYRYHGLTRRMLEVVASGELGAVRRYEGWFCIPLLMKDIRWDYRLAGGALMDTGGYVINLLRLLSGEEPVVRSARAWLRGDVERLIRAELEFADGRSAGITAALLSLRPWALGFQVIGEAATMDVRNPYLPQWGHRLTVRSAHGRRTETVPKQPSSYIEQLRAFAGAVLRGEPFPTTPEDAIANMRVIDACYAAAGLPRREPTPA